MPVSSYSLAMIFSTATVRCRPKASLNMAEMAKRMHDYGVNLMVGSDSPVPMVLPGYGLHKELELLVKGGFTPAEVLGLATINPAKFMDRKNIGKVAPEMLADLVILNANPLENISNTTLIDGVILRGKYLDRDKLDQLLNQAKSIANKQ